MFKTLSIRKPRLPGGPVNTGVTRNMKNSNFPRTGTSDEAAAGLPPIHDCAQPAANTTTTTSSKASTTAATNVGSNKSTGDCSLNTEPPADILIAGGGIIGLLLALALKKHLPNVTTVVYDQAPEFEPDVGAGMGLYANGLRVIRDIDPALLKDIQSASHPYMYRRWERHDGTEIAVADESVLSRKPDEDQGEDQSEEDDGICTMGIRRWKLQQVLHQAVAKAGIPVHFSKRIALVDTPENGMIDVVFSDGSRRQTQLLIGADGARSVVRTIFLGKKFENSATEMPTLCYTGDTCIMGVAANLENIRNGISFPVSTTTRCHGAFYPTGANEQCFQFHFPTMQDSKSCKSKDDSCWANLSQQVSRDECAKLASVLETDGWSEEKYLTPLRQVTRAVRVGFCQLTPALEEWSFPNAKGQPRIILVGDAAHPPVPYIGQGAQQGMEDAGTLAVLLKIFCLDDHSHFDLSHLHHAVAAYERIRIPRAAKILANGHEYGNSQAKSAQNPAYGMVREEKIQREVFFHETMPIWFEGARHDYNSDVKQELSRMASEHGRELPPQLIAKIIEV